VDRAVPQAVSPLVRWCVVGWRVDFCLRGVVEVAGGRAEPWAEPGHDAGMGGGVEPGHEAEMGGGGEPGHDTGAHGWGGTGYDTGVGGRGGAGHDTGGTGTAW
jgi:hypothetical protein